LENKDNKIELPDEVLFITNMCNNNCLICQDRTTGLSVTKTLEQLKEEVNKKHKLGVTGVSIYGGEPFTFFRLLNHQKSFFNWSFNPAK